MLEEEEIGTVETVGGVVVILILVVIAVILVWPRRSSE